MALVLTQQVDDILPIDVSGITPDQLTGLSLTDVKQRQVGFGNRNVPLSELFDVSGELQTDKLDEPTIHWSGKLSRVHWLGAGMKSGHMSASSSVGRHTGSRMSGGVIEISGDVSDYVGSEMTGGTIRVSGNAGDLAGANYPGSKFGMNRGEIFIVGDAGKGTGQRMRRGTIVVGGNCEKFAGWDMLAGTILVLGQCEGEVGINMSRGTIILTNANPSQSLLPPTFSEGATGRVPLFRPLTQWLEKVAPEFDVSSLVDGQFTQHHGDAIKDSRGEVFIATRS
jgi:formylmethanofuran dehydrogenase subunit C